MKVALPVYHLIKSNNAKLANMSKSETAAKAKAAFNSAKESYDAAYEAFVKARKAVTDAKLAYKVAANEESYASAVAYKVAATKTVNDSCKTLDVAKTLSNLEEDASILLSDAYECNNDFDSHHAWARYQFAQALVFERKYQMDKNNIDMDLAVKCRTIGEAELVSARLWKELNESSVYNHELRAKYHLTRADVYSLVGDLKRRDIELDLAKA